MPKSDQMLVLYTNVIQTSEFNLEELCLLLGIKPKVIEELIQYGTIDPQGDSFENWRFKPEHIKLIRTALHLHEDLEVNYAGAALAIDLMNEIQRLRSQLDILEKYFSAVIKEKISQK